MLNILIVDDEAIHREGIAQIIRKHRPDYCVQEACNGQEALQIAKANPMDLIVTDVRMPRMDGLKFVKSIRELNQQSYIVILSGYRNFDYAQKAMQLGASEYLVKPTRESDFLAVLQKIEEKIEADRKKEEATIQNTKKLDLSLPFYFEKLMNLWISGQSSQEELREIDELLPPQQQGVVLAVRLTNIQALQVACPPVLGINTQQQLKYLLKKHLELCGSSVSFFNTKDNQLLVCILLLKIEHDQASLCLSRQLEAFLTVIHDEFGLTGTIGIGTICDSILNEAATSYSLAHQALSGSFYQPENRIIQYDTSTDHFIATCPDLTRFEEPLLTAIRQNETVQIENLVDQLFAYSITPGLPPPDLLVKQIERLALNACSIVSGFMDTSLYKDWLNRVESRLSCCMDIQQLNDEFKKIMLEQVDWLVNLKNNKHDLIMKKCFEYLEDNLKEDLTLKMVADHFYFNPSYFSALFKEHAHMTFIKYVSKLRLKKAAELLDKGFYRVYEVAERVGFKDEKYFHRVFKREYGITPDEYRRIHKS